MRVQSRLAALATEVLGGPDVYDDTGEIFKKLFTGFEFKKIGFKNNVSTIELHSTSKAACCPECGMETTVIHDRPIRTVQDIMPGLGITLLRLVVNQFVCTNPDCKVKMFRENIVFVEARKRYTNRALQTMLEQSILISFRTAVESLRRLNIKVSRMTLSRLLLSIKIVNDFLIFEIGVDDVAKTRGTIYYTVIYDTVTHKPLALLDGRDGSALYEWLKEHPEVKEIRRDRASGYSKAGDSVKQFIEQFADKFHIFKNINDALKDFFYLNCAIQDVYVKVTEENGEKKVELLREPPKKVYVLRDVNLNQIPDNNYDCEPPRNEDGTLEQFNFSSYCVSAKEAERIYFNRLSAQEKAREVQEYCRKMEEKGEKIVFASVAKELDTSAYLVKKYMNMSEDEINDMTNPVHYNKKGPVCDVIYMIYKMMKDGIDSQTIFYMIKFKSDYSGTDSALVNYINAVAQNNFFFTNENVNLLHLMDEKLPEGVIHYSRTDVLRYILTVNPKTKVDSNIAAIIDELIEMYPLIETVQGCAQYFYRVMNSRTPDLIYDFIDKYEDIIPSFCRGLLKDIDAVKNAIRTGKTSGYVEGCNNTFKFVKRMGNGRYKRETLFIKFFLYLCRKDYNFDTAKIIETRTCSARG